MKTNLKKTALSVLFASAFVASHAHAESYGYEYERNGYGAGSEPQMESPLSLTLGVGVVYTPEFKGSSETNTWTLPYVSAKYRLNEKESLFLNMSEGLGYKYKLDDVWSFGVAASYRKGRDSKEDAKTVGMADVRHTAEVGGFVNMKMTPYATLSAKYMKGVGSNDGGYLQVGASTYRDLSPKLKGTVGISTIYADGEYMNDYYSVSVVDRTSTRAAYDADSGFSDVSLSSRLIYSHDDHHMVTTGLSYGMLVNDAKNSTIVSEDDYITAFIGYGYRF